MMKKKQIIAYFLTQHNAKYLSNNVESALVNPDYQPGSWFFSCATYNEVFTEFPAKPTLERKILTYAPGCWIIEVDGKVRCALDNSVLSYLVDFLGVGMPRCVTPKITFEVDAKADCFHSLI